MDPTTAAPVRPWKQALVIIAKDLDKGHSLCAFVNASEKPTQNGDQTQLRMFLLPQGPDASIRPDTTRGDPLLTSSSYGAHTRLFRRGLSPFRSFARLVRKSTFNEKFPYYALAILLVFGLIQIAWGERVPMNAGTGWDGAEYANTTIGFPGNIFRKQLDSYAVQRIIPEAVVNSGLRVLGLERSIENVIKGFEVYNLILLLTSAIIWSLLAENLKLAGRSKWLGFCFLFINFPVLKQNFYIPVATDITAFTLGLWLAYSFLKRNSLGVLMSAIIGAFTWPTFLYSSLLLYVFPNTNTVTRPPIVPAKHKLNIAVAILGGAGVLMAIVYLHYQRHIQLPYAQDQVNESLLLVSTLLVLAYILGSLRHLLDFGDLFNLQAISNSLKPGRLILGVASFLLVKMLIAVMDGGLQGAGGDITRTAHVVAFTVLTSVAKPAIFLISHVVYFGPVVLFFLYRFGTFARIIHQHGIGLTLYFVFYLMLALDAESRHLIDAFPWVVIFVTMFLDKVSWKPFHGWLIFASCLLFSKIWLPINNQPMRGSYLEFPWQYYFMNHGPWMSSLSYVIQMIFVVLTGGILFLCFRRVAHANTLMTGDDPQKLGTG